MKSNLTPLLLILAIFILSGVSTPVFAQQKIKIEFEKVKQKCKGLPFDKRVRITVARFNVTAPNAKRKGDFGDELATMLSNAIAEVNCFRVLSNLTNKADLIDEINFGQQGHTNENSSPQSGQMLGAQAVLTGEVTEFHEGEGRVGAFGITLSKNTAKIGFILQLVNPQTREILWSQSVEAEGKKPGKFSGLKILGLKVAGGSMQNTAIGDAVERGIIKAVVMLADERDEIPFPAVNSGRTVEKVWNYSNCPVLSSGNSPSVMILLAEKHMNRYRHLPSPSSESAIIKKFVNAGFNVIDPSMYAAMRKDARFEQAIRNPTAAASIGSDFGADVVIIGEGLSQVAQNKNGNVSCRATLSIKAIRVDNSRIISAQDTEAGALDITETAAASKSLKKAGNKVASLMLEQFCTQGMGQSVAGAGGSNLTTTKLIVMNTDFMKMRKLSSALLKNKKIEKAENTGFSNSKGELTIRHEGSSDDIMGIIAERLSSLCEITGYDPASKQVTVTMK